MIDEHIVFASSEERYSRRKSDEAYPIKSINDAFRCCKISPQDLDNVIIAGKAITLIPVLLRTFSNFSIKDHLRAMKEYWYPKLTQEKDVDILALFKNKIDTNQYPFNSPIAKEFNLSEIQYPITVNNEKLISSFYKRAISEDLRIDESKIIHLDHHICHAAYAFYGSPIRDDNTLILTADAWGDDLSGSISLFEKQQQKIKRVKEYRHKNFQLARIYRYTTLYLRMLPNEHEYKVMGLAPYYTGDKVLEVEKVFESMQTLEGLDFRFNSKIKDIYHYLEENLDSFRFDQIAAGLQSFTEKILSTWVQNALSEFNSKAVVFSGGVSLNVKANMQIAKLKEVEKFFVCGGGGDESLAIGACYSYAESQDISPKPLTDLYLGPDVQYQDTDLSEISAKYNIYKFVKVEQILEKIMDGKIIATCFGRMEMGPRALGNRSILADPRDFQNVEKINRKIKSRDFWMPFAPIILDEYQHELISNPKKLNSPFMTLAFDTVNGKEKIPAAVHMYDKTARPQILKKETNHIIWSLIKKFYDTTGIPALVNTSFNLHGEPIVSSLKDAFYVFENSGLDVLWLERHIIEKP